MTQVYSEFHSHPSEYSSGCQHQEPTPGVLVPLPVTSITARVSDGPVSLPPAPALPTQRSAAATHRTWPQSQSLQPQGCLPSLHLGDKTKHPVCASTTGVSRLLRPEAGTWGSWGGRRRACQRASCQPGCKQGSGPTTLPIVSEVWTGLGWADVPCRTTWGWSAQQGSYRGCSRKPTRCHFLTLRKVNWKCFPKLRP